MLSTVRGYYEAGRIYLKEDAPVHSKTEVIITFLTEEENQPAKKRIPGFPKGKVNLPDDFNAPLKDLKDYMWYRWISTFWTLTHSSGFRKTILKSRHQ